MFIIIDGETIDTTTNHPLYVEIENESMVEIIKGILTLSIK